MNLVKPSKEQDWFAFMSQPYWVEVKVEVDIEADAILGLRLMLGWDEVESKFSELRFSWVGVEFI